MSLRGRVGVIVQVFAAGMVFVAVCTGVLR